MISSMIYGHETGKTSLRIDRRGIRDLSRTGVQIGGRVRKVSISLQLFNSEFRKHYLIPETVQNGPLNIGTSQQMLINSINHHPPQSSS